MKMSKREFYIQPRRKLQIRTKHAVEKTKRIQAIKKCLLLAPTWCRDGELVDCKSILSLLTLGAAQGTVLTVSADGSDADDALKAITELFEAGFDDTNEVPGKQPAVDG